jgi:hypothetical protein
VLVLTESVARGTGIGDYPTTRPSNTELSSRTTVTETVKFAVAPHFGQGCGDCLFSLPLVRPLIKLQSLS